MPGPLGSRSSAKSRHFDDFLPKVHMRQPKTPADQAAIAKQVAHILGQGVGGHIEVLRPNAQQ